MLEAVKKALRISASTTIYDDDVQDLIDAALLDLGIAGIAAYETDKLVLMAVKTYCRMHFGNVAMDEYDRLAKSYDVQKAQLQTASDYKEM